MGLRDCWNTPGQDSITDVILLVLTNRRGKELKRPSMTDNILEVLDGAGRQAVDRSFHSGTIEYQCVMFHYWPETGIITDEQRNISIRCAVSHSSKLPAVFAWMRFNHGRVELQTRVSLSLRCKKRGAVITDDNIAYLSGAVAEIGDIF